MLFRSGTALISGFRDLNRSSSSMAPPTPRFLAPILRAAFSQQPFVCLQPSFFLPRVRPGLGNGSCAMLTLPFSDCLTPRHRVILLRHFHGRGFRHVKGCSACRLNVWLADVNAGILGGPVRLDLLSVVCPNRDSLKAGRTPFN